MIIACGTAERGDDAAGLLAARRLREAGLEVHEHSRDGLALMELWSGHEDVILIDAVVTGAAAGAVKVWDGRHAPVEPDAFPSTHAFGVAEAIRLAKALGRMPARMTIYGIEAKRFDTGSGPSAQVLQGVDDVVKMITSRR